MNVNLRGVLIVTQQVLASMLERRAAAQASEGVTDGVAPGSGSRTGRRSPG
jgi:hypothetical protein